MRSTLAPFLALFIFASASSHSLGGNVNKSTDDIKIGAFLSLTGSTSAYGISALNAFKLATEEVNVAGGIMGRRVELVVEDDHSNTAEVAGIVTKLIKQDSVHALLAEPISTRAMVAAPIAQEHKVVLISPAAIKPELTMQGDYIFRACFTSPVEGEAIARFATKRLKARRVAIILDRKNDYAVVLAGFFSESFRRFGGEIISQQHYEATDKDIAAQIKAISASKPDVIFAPGFYSTAGLVASEIKRQGVKAHLIGSDGWDSPSLLEGAGNAFEGVYFANHFWVGSDEPLVRKFVADYQAKFGLAPDAGAATAYDAARLLFDAIKRAKSTDSAAIRAALSQTANFPGVTGRITIDANRNARVPVYMLRIGKGGRFSLQSAGS